MCPNEDLKSNKSDCSLDEERQRAVQGGPPVVGYRANFGEEGACLALRKFSTRVAQGDICVGDCDNKVRLEERIAGGSFGEVYLGKMGDGRRVAAKVEPQGADAKYLLNEGNVYRNLEGGPGIPTVYWFGMHGPEYGVLVMDLLGPTLQDLLLECHGQFSLHTVLQLADQMIDILEHVHSRGYVHRDISPSNFMLGSSGGATGSGDPDSPGGRKLYLIDFGHAKKFNTVMRMMSRRNSLSGMRAIVGTPRFISVNAHAGREESPRDDIEALIYIWLFLLRGRLPWQGIEASTMQEKLKKIAQIKLSTPVESVCEGVPEEFAICMEYVRNLKQYEPINYPGIKTLLRNLATKKDLSYDGHYDWTENEPTDEPAAGVADTIVQNGTCTDFPQDGMQSEGMAVSAGSH